MTADQLFAWMRPRVATKVCARCGKEGIAYYARADESRVCSSCVYGWRSSIEAEEEQARQASEARLHSLNHGTTFPGWRVDEVRE